MSEAFNKSFSMYVELAPQSIIDRIENMKDKNTDIKVTSQDSGDFSVEIRRKWGFANPYLRFRVWKPEPNIKFSQIDGTAGAFIHWYNFVSLFLLTLFLPCCACITIFLSPERRHFGFGYVAPARQGDNWVIFYSLVALIVLFLLANILGVISSPLARYFLLREFRYYLPDEEVHEKKKRS